MHVHLIIISRYYPSYGLVKFPHPELKSSIYTSLLLEPSILLVTKNRCGCHQPESPKPPMLSPKNCLYIIIPMSTKVSVKLDRSLASSLIINYAGEVAVDVVVKKIICRDYDLLRGLNFGSPSIPQLMNFVELIMVDGRGFEVYLTWTLDRLSILQLFNLFVLGMVFRSILVPL